MAWQARDLQGSSLALEPTSELQTLANEDSSSPSASDFPTFVNGYQTIYLEELPLYVSADSILYACIVVRSVLR